MYSSFVFFLSWKRVIKCWKFLMIVKTNKKFLKNEQFIFIWINSHFRKESIQSTIWMYKNTKIAAVLILQWYILRWISYQTNFKNSFVIFFSSNIFQSSSVTMLIKSPSSSKRNEFAQNYTLRWTFKIYSMCLNTFIVKFSSIPTVFGRKMTWDFSLQFFDTQIEIISKCRFIVVCWITQNTYFAYVRYFGYIRHFAINFNELYDILETSLNYFLMMKNCVRKEKSVPVVYRYRKSTEDHMNPHLILHLKQRDSLCMQMYARLLRDVLRRI